MPHEDYKWYIRQMEIIVNDNGKRLMAGTPHWRVTHGFHVHQPLLVRLHRRRSPLIKPEWFNQHRQVITTPMNAPRFRV